MTHANSFWVRIKPPAASIKQCGKAKPSIIAPAHGFCTSWLFGGAHGSLPTKICTQAKSLKAMAPAGAGIWFTYFVAKTLKCPRTQPPHPTPAPRPEEIEAAMAANASDEMERLREGERTQAKSADLADQFLRAKAEAETPPPRRRRSRQGAQVRHRGAFAESLLPVCRQPGSGLAMPKATAANCAKAPMPRCASWQHWNATRCCPSTRPLATSSTHNMHQAISMVPSARKGPNTVVTVLQKGYLIAERVLRPALVTVSAPNKIRTAGLEAGNLSTGAPPPSKSTNFTEQHGKIIGIDLGTTNSCVSIMEGNTTKRDRNARARAPRPPSSPTRKTANPRRRLGQAPGRDQPKNTLYAVKRLIGRKFTERKCRRTST